MVIGIGTDIVEIARIADVLDRQGDAFVQRILTHSEQKQYQASKQKAAFLAKRFAAKEAVAMNTTARHTILDEAVTK